jgi:hypothetical protein
MNTLLYTNRNTYTVETLWGKLAVMVSDKVVVATNYADLRQGVVEVERADMEAAQRVLRY